MRRQRSSKAEAANNKRVIVHYLADGYTCKDGIRDVVTVLPLDDVGCTGEEFGNLSLGCEVQHYRLALESYVVQGSSVCTIKDAACNRYVEGQAECVPRTVFEQGAVCELNVIAFLAIERFDEACVVFVVGKHNEWCFHSGESRRSPSAFLLSFNAFHFPIVFGAGSKVCNLTRSLVSRYLNPKTSSPKSGSWPLATSVSVPPSSTLGIISQLSGVKGPISLMKLADETAYVPL